MSAPSTPTPTKRAAAFMAANATSPIVTGIISADMFATYQLEDRTIYRLSPEDVATLPDKLRWLHG